MTNCILGMFVMWFILSLIIALGDELFNQNCEWDSWFIFIVCFPMVIFYYVPVLIVRAIKAKRNRKK